MILLFLILLTSHYLMLESTASITDENYFFRETCKMAANIIKTDGFTDSCLNTTRQIYEFCDDSTSKSDDKLRNSSSSNPQHNNNEMLCAVFKRVIGEKNGGFSDLKIKIYHKLKDNGLISGKHHQALLNISESLDEDFFEDVFNNSNSNDSNLNDDDEGISIEEISTNNQEQEVSASIIDRIVRMVRYAITAIIVYVRVYAEATSYGIKTFLASFFSKNIKDSITPNSALNSDSNSIFGSDKMAIAY